MDILFLLIPLSLVLLSLAIWGFFWAVKNNQFEDLEGPAYSILFDDDEPHHPQNPKPELNKEPELNKAPELDKEPENSIATTAISDAAQSNTSKNS